MIEASRRRRSDARSEDLTLHRRLAWGESWHRRLTVGSSAALAASAVAWLAGVPLIWHAAAIAAAGLAGAAWPVPDPTERALRWIANSTGLAYETALSRASADAWGLREAVDARAKATAARLRPPTRQRWWIPLLAVAVGLLLLPAAQLARPDGGGGASSTPGESAEAPAPEPMPEDSVAPFEEQEDPARATEPQGEEGETSTDAAQEPGAGAGSEEETLSRFLENLRERDPFRSVDPPPEEQGAPPQSQPREDQPGERTPGARESEDGEQQASEEQQAGDPSEGAGDEGEGEQDGQQGVPEEGPEEGREPGEPGPSQGEEPGDPQEGEAPAGGDEPGQDDRQLQPEGSSGVGAAPSAEQPTEGLDDAAQSEPEFLPGQLEEGPENPGGTVLLPGEDDIDVPRELRRDEYRRAVEEAVTDGQVPLEYQEIIRNYFR